MIDCPARVIVIDDTDTLTLMSILFLFAGNIVTRERRCRQLTGKESLQRDNTHGWTVPSGLGIVRV